MLCETNSSGRERVQINKIARDLIAQWQGDRTRSEGRASRRYENKRRLARVRTLRAEHYLAREISVNQVDR